jgi:hypothetical protein
MKPSTTTTKNVSLAFEVIRQVIAEPSLAQEMDDLSADGTLVLYDDADEELTAANDKIAASYENRGEPVVRVALQRRLNLVQR